MSTEVLDRLALAGTSVAGGVAAHGWLVTANGIATLAVSVVTVIGVIVATVYHYERWTKLRRQRKENE